MLEKDPAEFENQLRDIDDFFYGLMKPEVFGGKNGKEVNFYKDFERTCNVMRQHGCPEPKRMKTREFLQFLEDLRKQMKQRKK